MYQHNIRNLNGGSQAYVLPWFRLVFSRSFSTSKSDSSLARLLNPHHGCLVRSAEIPQLRASLRCAAYYSIQSPLHRD